LPLLYYQQFNIYIMAKVKVALSNPPAPTPSIKDQKVKVEKVSQQQKVTTEVSQAKVADKKK